MRRAAVIISVMLLATTAYGAFTAGSVLDRVKVAFDDIEDYSAQAVMQVDSPTLRVKDSKFKLYYKKPDKVHIQPLGGFALIPQGTFLGNPMEQITHDGVPTLKGTARLDGRLCWVLQVTPKSRTPGNYEFTLWVEQTRGLIVASAAEPAEGAKVDVKWEYTKVDDKYWLPSRISVKIDGLPARMTREHGPFTQQSGKASGTAMIEFSNYHVNKGIPNSMFRRNSEE
jgi:hypothetical protein